MDALVLSVADTAALLGISMQHVYDLLDEDVLPEVTLGRRRLVPRWAIEQLVDARRSDWDPTAARRRLAEVA